MRTPRRATAPIRFAAIAGVAALVLSGCGVRIGQPPSPIPSPDAAETTRQSAAIAVERALAGAHGATDAPAGLEAVAAQYLADLGGVWIPPPRDDDPSPISPALAQDNSDLPAVLADGADLLLDLAHAADPAGSDSLVYASIWLSLRTAAKNSAAAAAPPCTIPCGAGVIPPVFAAAMEQGEEHDLLALLDTLHAHAPELIAVYDGLGYLEEVRAARANLQARDDLAAGAAKLRDFADFLAGNAAGSEADLRQSAYRFEVDDLDGAIGAYTEQAVRGWLAVIAGSGENPPADVAAAVSALDHAYGITNPTHTVELWPGFASED